MPIQCPTPDQLRDVAAQCGLSLSDADVESFRQLMRGSIAHYNAVDAMADEGAAGALSAHPRLPSGARGEPAKRMVPQDVDRGCGERPARGQAGGAQG